MKKVLFDCSIQDADTVGSVPLNIDMLKRYVENYSGINIGNRVFISATEQYLTKSDIILDYYPCLDLNPIEVSERYDYVVSAYANIFNPEMNSFLGRVAKWISQLRIPFYVVGCGIQGDDYKQLNYVRKLIGKNAAEFVASVENTGGKIATRGHITKEFLDQCLKNDAVATGCPGLYRRGSQFRLEKKDISRDEFSVAFTSWDYPINWLKMQLQKYPRSTIVDQQEFFSRRLKYDDITRFVDSASMDLGGVFIKELVAGRIYAPTEISCWADKLSEYAYAYGGRLHGTIMALYAGIPAKLYCKDLRCKEVADFIGLPAIDKYDCRTDLYDDYCSTNLELFNEKYKTGYSIFKQFMENNGITYELDNHDDWDKKIQNITFVDVKMLSSDELNAIERYYGSKRYYLNNNNLVHFSKKINRKVGITAKKLLNNER